MSSTIKRMQPNLYASRFYVKYVFVHCSDFYASLCTAVATFLIICFLAFDICTYLKQATDCNNAKMTTIEVEICTKI